MMTRSYMLKPYIFKPVHNIWTKTCFFPLYVLPKAIMKVGHVSNGYTDTNVTITDLDSGRPQKRTPGSKNTLPLAGESTVADTCKQTWRITNQPNKQAGGFIWILCFSKNLNDKVLSLNSENMLKMHDFNYLQKEEWSAETKGLVFYDEYKLRFRTGGSILPFGHSGFC